MDYRREIDGLRALAVLPVILFHSGIESFSGGFVGVDVFFVISGYLITTIIIKELDQGNFSTVKFYERRARRILPALFLVMFTSLVAGYFLLMPDEYKNFGQSLVATSLFSNNILLGLTTGYWDLASEFKPLLHTWSLGVEEQYYVIVPFFLLIVWRINAIKVEYLFLAIFSASFLFAIWLVNVSPDWAFYILPTRAWEICIGALAALYIRRYPSIGNIRYSGILAVIGLALILTSIFTFDKTVLSPGHLLLVPTVGTVLIVVFCRPGTFVFKVLGNRVVVFIGLLSYSLYLWHQPMFAFLRAYSREQPSALEFAALLPIVFAASILSWRFVEIPFRNRSVVKTKSVFVFAGLSSIFFISAGLYLNASYGMPQRAFENGILVQDMDKRFYNERAFQYKADSFPDNSKTNILIVGDSFARDFTNMTMETFDTDQVNIVYRDDIAECIDSIGTGVGSKLYHDADVIVFSKTHYSMECIPNDMEFATSRDKQIYYVGTKSFGYNLNWLIRLDQSERQNQYNRIDDSLAESDEALLKIIPRQNFISLLEPTLVDGRMPITDERGRMLSTDRAHLTKYGAQYFGRIAVKSTPYASIFE